MEFAPLPEDQMRMISWMVDELEGILQTPGKMGWIARWLEVCPRERRPSRHTFRMRSLFFDENIRFFICFLNTRV